MYWVYVLKSKRFPKSYVGQTNDLTRRLLEHNSGKSYYTKRYSPWEILYTEEYVTNSEAISRERFLKTSAGRRFLEGLFTNK